MKVSEACDKFSICIQQQEGNVLLFHDTVLFVCAESLGDGDAKEVSCSPWTNKLPKVVQPDLNFIGTGNLIKLQTVINIFLFFLLFSPRNAA